MLTARCGSTGKCPAMAANSGGPFSTGCIAGSSKPRTDSDRLFSGHCPVADIGAIKHAVPVYLAGEGVGVFLGFGNRVTQRGRAQYPAAIGQHRAARLARAGMK